MHHYFGVDWDIVWKVINGELPELKKNVEDILNKEKLWPNKFKFFVREDFLGFEKRGR